MVIIENYMTEPDIPPRGEEWESRGGMEGMDGYEGVRAIAVEAGERGSVGRSIVGPGRDVLALALSIRALSSSPPSPVVRRG